MRRAGQRVALTRLRGAAVAAGCGLSAPPVIWAGAPAAGPGAGARGAAAAQVRWCTAEPEVISLDDIEVEAAGWSPEHAEHHDNQSPGNSQGDTQHTSNGGGAKKAADGADASASGENEGGGVSTTLVQTVDTFSKSKVLNYLKRACRDRGVHFDSQAAFETEADTIEGPDGNDIAVFRARVRLVCPAPHNLKIGSGVASDPKDAEVLAAMHAERLLDALGVPLYALSGMQQKHAEAARKAGRWAPMPGDKVKPADTPTPPPLVLASTFSGRTPEQAEAEAEAEEAAVATAAGAKASSDFLRDYYCHAAEAADFWEGMSATQAASAAMYDASEGNKFQPVALQSTRRSSTEVAITLPIIFDPNARKRIAAFLDGADLDRVTKTTNAPVKGTTYRMFTAELPLGAATGGLVGVGKALEKKAAIDLAAMHAELLLDFHGHLLYPTDPKKQLKHAQVAKGCGRWAAETADDAARRPSRDSRLAPLPLKQTIGPAAESEGLYALAKDGNGSTSAPGATRNYTERIIMAHNVLSMQWDNTYVEVLPPQALLTEARALIHDWMLRARCKFPDLYVSTTMGEFTRASLILPLPSSYGVRGGNSVGRTSEQAMDLCAMNALDVLCFFGVPVCADPADQLAFMHRRRALGLVANRPYVAPVTPGEGAGTAAPAEDVDADDPMAEFPMAPAPSPRAFAPPGYYSEGSVERPLPKHKDVFAALAESPEHTAALALGTAESLIASGNEQKPNVQAYVRRLRDGKEAVPTVVQTGSSPTVRNVVYLQVPLPADRFGPDAVVMAVGHGLKKKDADRMCWMHAYALLEANGIPQLSRQKEVELQEMRAKKKAALAAMPQPMSKKKKRQLALQEEERRKAEAAAAAAAKAAEGQAAATASDSSGDAAAPTAATPPPLPSATPIDPAPAAEPVPPEPSAAKENAPADADVKANAETEVSAPLPTFETPTLVPPLMHPALDALLRREAEMQEKRRARPKLFSDNQR